jgi:hypothetical protein
VNHKISKKKRRSSAPHACASVRPPRPHGAASSAASSVSRGGRRKGKEGVAASSVSRGGRRKGRGRKEDGKERGGGRREEDRSVGEEVVVIVEERIRNRDYILC